MFRFAVISRIALAGLALASAATFAGSADWRIELFAHWPFHYAAAAGPLAAWFLLLRMRREAGLATALLAFNLAVALSGGWRIARPASADSGPPRANLRVVSFNVLRSNRSHDLVLAWLRQSDAGVIGLIEVTRPWQQAITQLADLYPYQFSDLGDRYGDGIAILSRFPFCGQRKLRPGGGVKLALQACIAPDGVPVDVIGVHPMPPRNGYEAHQHRIYLDGLGKLLSDWPRPVVVMGDLNDTPWSPTYRAFAREAGVGRASRLFATWPTRLRFAGIPIDHVLAGHGAQAVDTIRGPRLKSDHYPLIAEIAVR